MFVVRLANPKSITISDGVVPTFQGAGGPWGSSVYYSDDFGRSWNKSTDFSPGSAEGEVVQIPGHPRGDLLANLRNINANGSWGCGALANGMCRVTARSTSVPYRSVSPLCRPCLTLRVCLLAGTAV